MGILNKYIYKEFFYPFLSGSLFFTMLFVVPELRRLVPLVIEKNVPISIVLELFIYLIPVTASITIPMGTLFGALFSLGRLSQDSEIIAMRATGISLYKIFKPIFIVGIITSVFLFYFMNYILTETSLRYNSIYLNVIHANPGVIMSSKEFTSFSDSSQQITAVDIDKEGNMYSVYLYERGEGSKEIRVVYAEKGIWVNNNFNSKQTSLKLYQGELIRFNTNRPNVLERVNFKEMVFNVIKDYQSVQLADKGLQELNVFEVNAMIEQQMKLQQEVSPFIYVELHRKFSVPIACLAFVIMAIPLAVSFQRSGKGIGLGMSLIVILIYYILLSTAEALGKKAIINPSWVMHLPNIMFGVIGLVLFIIKTRK